MEQFDSIYFRGQGPLFIANRDASGNPLGLDFVGDVGAVSMTPKVDRFEVIENVTGKGGVAASGIKRVSYDIKIEFKSIKPSHLAAAIKGALTVKPAGTVTAEPHTAYAGKMVVLANTKVNTVVVTNSAGTVTHTVGTDYVVHAAEGLIEILTTGVITDATDIRINYAYAAQQAITVNPVDSDKYLVFAGMNTANSDKQIRVTLYKVRLDPSALDNLISDDPQSMSIAGVLMMDTLRPVGDQLYHIIAED